MLPIVSEIARLYLWRLFPDGKRARFYSVNVMRARYPTRFKEDLQQLFALLGIGAIRPRIAAKISFDEVADAHRNLEAGGLEGKLVLCPDLTSRRDRVRRQHELSHTSV
jgi:NADPH:quinone reductase